MMKFLPSMAVGWGDRIKISMFDLISMGEVMAEIRQSPEEGYQVGFAGDTFNTAVYCQRLLGLQGKVAYLTRVGADPLSQSWQAFAAAEELDVSHVSVDAEANLGIYSVSTDTSGERSFHYWRDQSAARKLFKNDAEAIKIPPARVTYLSGISLAILCASARRRVMDYLAAESKAGNTLVAFDSNYRPRLWESEKVARSVMSEMWEIADIGLPSIDDERALFADASDAKVIERFAQREWVACAIKRGEQGPVSPKLVNDLNLDFHPAINVVDTTAAGDSFNGGYLSAFLSGQPETECLQAGHDCASFVVGVRGAIAPATST